MGHKGHFKRLEQNNNDTNHWNVVDKNLANAVDFDAFPEDLAEANVSDLKKMSSRRKNFFWQCLFGTAEASLRVQSTEHMEQKLQPTKKKQVFRHRLEVWDIRNREQRSKMVTCICS